MGIVEDAEDLSENHNSCDAGASQTTWTVYRREEQDGKPDIYFGLIPGVIPSVEMNLFKSNVEFTLSSIDIIFPYSNYRYRKVHNENFEKLLSISQLGLVGKKPSIEAAKLALDSFQTNILHSETGRIKNGYMRSLGIASLFLFVLGFFISILTHLISPFQYDITVIRMMSLLWSFSMIGCWASYGIRKPNFTYQDLTIIEEDRVEPFLRLILCGILTVTLGLIFISGFADVRIGDFSASSISNNYVSVCLVGLLSGISELALPSVIAQRSSSLVSKM